MVMVRDLTNVLTADERRSHDEDGKITEDFKNIPTPVYSINFVYFGFIICNSWSCLERLKK